ncbi:Na+/H+ antiporter subunit G [candidate division FCPU426 bacterium]|nr:Na+/H+ antiporter subunit G [candidate division FCPU426 bacterium]
MIKYLGIALLYAGVLFDLIGCIGLVRLPDVYNRLQAATKCVTLGTCMILAGTILMTTSLILAIQGIICLVFILITSPTAAHALARGAYKAGVKLWDKSIVDHYGEDQS